MKLDQLLKQLDGPPPWKFLPEAVIHNTPEADYALHASNELPELVAAAEAARETMRVLHAYNHSENDRKAILSRSLGALAAALARAEEVKCVITPEQAHAGFDAAYADYYKNKPQDDL